ncbi:MAG TPA: AprI/Inh family metalloprotease inhibitor [Caulobacteraceae bacterium]|jgi:hypothetical protein|nr:AprI/Inh family metalloprotease inhibitor [Caulobacteraceae bacterium]
MKTLVMLFAAALASPAIAQTGDHEAGVPLTPAEAAGAWVLESGGHSLCALTLGTAKTGGGYAVKRAADCTGNLPGQPVAWAPTGDGMKLVSASGQTVLAFGRWSNSLFVAHRSSGVDVQLRRGG